MTPKYNPLGRITDSHIVTIGNTGSGKTNLANLLLLDETEDPQTSIVVLDAQKNAMAKSFIEHCVRRGLTHRLIVENIGRTDWVLPFQLIRRSTNPDPIQRALENEKSALGFTDLLIRQQGNKRLSEQPLKQEQTLLAINFWLYQEKDLPLSYLPYAFIPSSEEFQEMLRGCTHEMTRYQFKDLFRLAGRSLVAFDKKVESARRLINATFNSVAVQIRLGGSVNLHDLLDEGKIIVIEGDPDRLGDETIRMIFGCINQMVFQYARPGCRRTILFNEELDRYALIGRHEIEALETTRKYGVFYRGNSQTLRMPPELLQSFLNNTDHVWMRIGDQETAMLAARDVGIASLDFHRVHHTDTTTRTISDGYHEHHREGGKKQLVRGERYVHDSRDSYWSTNDQILEKAQQFLSMKPGEFILKHQGKVHSKRRCALLGDAWVGSAKRTERKMAKAMEQILSQEIYQEVKAKEEESAADRFRTGSETH